MGVLDTYKVDRLGLVDIINLEIYHWQILQTRISLLQYLIKISMKSPIKAVF